MYSNFDCKVNWSIFFVLLIYQLIALCSTICSCHLSCLMSRRCRDCVEKKVNLPLLGETSIVSLVVCCCCLAFAIVWIVNRRTSYSWIGQDILVSFMCEYRLVLDAFLYCKEMTAVAKYETSKI